MGYIEGESRHQSTLFPESLDDYISEENPVRFIDAFVDHLDLKQLGFTRSEPAATGRPGYAPGLMLKLYIYGYLNRVRSSRRLEKEAIRNVELLWLTQRLTPDFKTIADFRKDNHRRFIKVFRQFTLMCRKLDLFGGELIAVDGSKIKAMNNKRRNFTKAKLKRELHIIDSKIEQYLKELDEADDTETAVNKPTAQELQEKIKKLKKRKTEREGHLDTLEESGQRQISLTDADSRAMATPKADVAYNVQTAVDEKHRMIVEQDVTNAVTDANELSPMCIAAKETLGVDELKAVADMGYSNAKQTALCEEHGIEPFVPKPYTSASAKKGMFGKDDFRYDAKEDCYVCPANERLTYRSSGHAKGRDIRWYATSACRDCALRSKCTRREKGRRLTRLENEEVIERMTKRVSTNVELMRKRKTMVEHPYGTIKFWWGHNHFLMRGLDKVKGEFSLSTLAYNLTRAMNILGVRRLIAALG